MLKNNRRLSSTGLCFAIVALFAAIVSLYACRGNNKPLTQDEIVAQGKTLSETYCKSCHSYPDPSLLDKHIWESRVLPAMAKQLGIQTGMGQYYADMQSRISGPDWEKIVAFYKALAPKQLTVPQNTAANDWAIFSLVKPGKLPAKYKIANTTLIKFDTATQKLYTADAANNLFSWDSRLQPKVVAAMPSPVSSVNFAQTPGGKGNTVFTCIGILPPNDELKGTLEQLDLSTNGPVSQTIVDSLPRPVQTITGDFNRDGLTDYIVCGYGNTKGGLYLVQQQADHTFRKKVIRAMPGAIQVQTGDFNNDGWPDVMCLFAQADEGIWMFLNDKKGGFTTKNLLHFPPVYGSNSFQLADMNNDGLPDIVYTCGDNNDYSPILKPYHGVYIFTNKGSWRFRKSDFYHINGASKVMAADFNGDKKLDLAVISFFPDFSKSPAEGFTYLEQLPDQKFKAHQLPINLQGRWLVMDVCDIDQDGDPDVVLGNFSIFEDRLNNQKDFKPNWDRRQPFVVLKNTTK